MPPARRFHAVDALAIVVIVATALLYTREIGNDFLWGHDGGNGAPNWNGAANSLRFGVIGQLKDYTGLGPPSPADFYTHHPQAIHYHLVVVRALFGGMEWVGRLVPYAYSVLTLALLYLVGRAHYGRPTALAALVLYALTPLHLVFATMISHEQGGVFWTLLACHAALRWQKFAKRRDLILLVAAATCAMQFAWASYFVLAVTGALALVAWWRSPPRGLPATRARSVAAVLFVLAIANLGAFFVMVRVTKGSTSEMQTAFAQRASEVSGYVDSTLQRALDLYGALILGLGAAGLAQLVGRVRAGRWRARDVLPVSFLVGQLGLSLAFRNAGRIHSYWTYSAGVAGALLGADAVVSAGRHLARRIQRPQLVAIGAVVFALQATFAVSQQSWGMATGHAAYAQSFDDMFEEVQLAKWLNAHYGRDVTYRISPSLNARTEVFCALDAPHAEVELDTPPPSCGATRACVLLVDLRHLKDGVTLAHASRQAAEHPASLFAGHFLVVELSSKAAAPRAYRLEQTRPTPAHAWFVSGAHGLASWKAVDDPAESLRAALVDLGTPDYVAESSKSGIALGEPCPRGVPLTGLVARRRDGAVTALQGMCGHGVARSRSRWMGATSGSDGGSDLETTCQSGEGVVAVGMGGPSDLGGASLGCAPLSMGAPAAPMTSSGYVLACPARSVAISLHVRQEGAQLSGLGIGCTTL